jgi:hypothetical protein
MTVASVRCLFALVLLAVVLAPHPTVAQEASPVPATGSRDVPSPAECVVEPRTAEELLSLHATPVADTSAAERPAPEVPFGAPDGDAADPATVAAVTAVIRQE